MTYRTVARAGAVSGFLYALLLFTTSFISDDGLALRIGVVALVLFIPFLVSLWCVLRRAEGQHEWLATTALAAGLVSLVLRLGEGPVAVAKEANTIDPRLDDALDNMMNAAYILSMLPLAVVTATTGVVVFQTGALPRWLGWLSFLTAAALLVNGLFIYGHEGPAFLLFLLWLLATSLVLTRRLGRFPSPPPTPEGSPPQAAH
jgi:hypothetical protein